MANVSLDDRIKRIRLKNQEIIRRYEEVEADKRLAEQVNACVQLNPAKITSVECCKLITERAGDVTNSNTLGQRFIATSKTFETAATQCASSGCIIESSVHTDNSRYENTNLQPTLSPQTKPVNIVNYTQNNWSRSQNDCYREVTGTGSCYFGVGECGKLTDNNITFACDAVKESRLPPDGSDHLQCTLQKDIQPESSHCDASKEAALHNTLSVSLHGTDHLCIGEFASQESETCESVHNVSTGTVLHNRHARQHVEIIKTDNLHTRMESRGHDRRGFDGRVTRGVHRAWHTRTPLIRAMTVDTEYMNNDASFSPLVSGIDIYSDRYPVQLSAAELFAEGALLLSTENGVEENPERTIGRTSGRFQTSGRAFCRGSRHLQQLDCAEHLFTKHTNSASSEAKSFKK